jgi:hypothetical protein
VKLKENKMTENSINLNSSVDDVVDFLEEAGLGELKEKFQGEITICIFFFKKNV